MQPNKKVINGDEHDEVEGNGLGDECFSEQSTPAANGTQLRRHDKR